MATVDADIEVPEPLAQPSLRLENKHWNPILAPNTAGMQFASCHRIALFSSTRPDLFTAFELHTLPYASARYRIVRFGVLATPWSRLDFGMYLPATPFHGDSDITVMGIAQLFFR